MERKEPSYSVGGNVNWCSQLFDREDPLDKGMTTPSSRICLCFKNFPGDSDGTVSAYNGGDPGFIPGSGRSTGEGKGYPLQYSGLENLQSMVSQRVGHD